MPCGYALTRNRPHGLPSCWAWIVFPPLHDHDGVGAAQKGPNSGPSGQARDWVAPVRDEHLVRFTALVGGRLVVVHAGFASAPKNLCKVKGNARSGCQGNPLISLAGTIFGSRCEAFTTFRVRTGCVVSQPVLVRLVGRSARWAAVSFALADAGGPAGFPYSSSSPSRTRRYALHGGCFKSPCSSTFLPNRRGIRWGPSEL